MRNPSASIMQCSLSLAFGLACRSDITLCILLIAFYVTVAAGLATVFESGEHFGAVTLGITAMRANDIAVKHKPLNYVALTGHIRQSPAVKSGYRNGSIFPCHGYLKDIQPDTAAAVQAPGQRQKSRLY